MRIFAAGLLAYLPIFSAADPLFEMYIKRAESGDSAAQVLVGSMYDQGLAGVVQDYKKAVGWYQRAAEQDNADGQEMLGLHYTLGHGVPEDLKQSYIWCSIAWSNGKRNTARKCRDNAARVLSPAMLEDAQEEAGALARRIKQKNPGKS